MRDQISTATMHLLLVLHLHLHLLAAGLALQVDGTSIGASSQPLPVISSSSSSSSESMQELQNSLPHQQHHNEAEPQDYIHVNHQLGLQQPQYHLQATSSSHLHNHHRSQHLHEPSGNNGSLSSGAGNSIGLGEARHKAMLQHQSINKLQRHLNERQQELIRKHPGSLVALARALKMTIVECQYQTRHEPWDCPTHGFSIRPKDIFGKLMLRSFKETSFVHSLLSSAITHSVARACTESLIDTCQSRQISGGQFRENVEFGRYFAQQFMEATNEQLVQSPTATSTSSTTTTTSTSTTQAPLSQLDRSSNSISSGDEGDQGDPGDQQQLAPAPTPDFATEKLARDLRIRNLINAHNDALGQLHVLKGMKQVCKCHGLSGSCTTHTCWEKLPPFRDVASKLHETLERAMLVLPRQASQSSAIGQHLGSGAASGAPSSPGSQAAGGQRRQSLTSSGRKSNKKRSSSAQVVNGFGRSATGGGGGGQQQQETGGAGTGGAAGPAPAKRRPVARSIGAQPLMPTPLDLLYLDESPDFCLPNEAYNIKGTRGRVCSENPNASNSCRRLCCGRGYKTKVREEKYKCECQFKYCCKLDCNTCTRRKVVHKCL